MKIQKKNIDLVYLWVDGSDPQWQKRRDEALLLRGEKKHINIQGRYESNDELRYSLRSVTKHLPWVRNIYIITDNQTPSWLNTAHSNIHIIDHTEIMPPEALPCFNSAVIEYFIYRIPGLSEQFLYANDDMFVNSDLEPAFFFTDSGLPKVRFQRQYFQRTESKLKRWLSISVNSYRKSIENSIELIKEKYSLFFPGVSHHNIDAYLKSDFRAVVEELFSNELKEVYRNQFRDDSDIQRILFQYNSLALGRGELYYVKRNESARIRVQHPDFFAFIEKYRPKLFCLNDTEHATDDDRSRIRPLLESFFPEKSAFEM